MVSGAKRKSATKPSMAGTKKAAKVEKKLTKKVKFYAKVKAVGELLNPKKTINKKKKLRSRQKKLKPYDLSVLSDCLPDTNVSEKRPPTINLKMNGKNRQKLVEKESEHLKLVLDNPTFQADPLATLYQHLQMTQPPPSETEKVPGKNKKKDKKKRGKKSATKSQMMEM